MACRPRYGYQCNASPPFAPVAGGFVDERGWYCYPRKGPWADTQGPYAEAFPTPPVATGRARAMHASSPYYGDVFGRGARFGGIGPNPVAVEFVAQAYGGTIAQAGGQLFFLWEPALRAELELMSGRPVPHVVAIDPFCNQTFGTMPAPGDYVDPRTGLACMPMNLGFDKFDLDLERARDRMTPPRYIDG